MQAFNAKADFSVVGTVVPYENRTTAGISIAGKSVRSFGDGSIGPLGDPGEEGKDENEGQGRGQTIGVQVV